MTVLYIIYLVLAIVVIALVAALFMPGRYHVEKTAIIQKPVQHVMNKVADLYFYAQWNPWQQMELTSKQQVSGTPCVPGHMYKWEGKKIGTGSLTLRDIDKKHVHFDLEFIKPWKARASDNWLFEEWGNDETKVTWQNNGELPYPMARLMGPLLNKNLHKQFTEGLKNLKKLCEG